MVVFPQVTRLCAEFASNPTPRSSEICRIWQIGLPMAPRIRDYCPANLMRSILLSLPFLEPAVTNTSLAPGVTVTGSPLTVSSFASFRAFCQLLHTELGFHMCEDGGQGPIARWPRMSMYRDK